jgi:hypothetical protein
LPGKSDNGVAWLFLFAIIFVLRTATTKYSGTNLSFAQFARTNKASEQLKE